MKELAMSEDPVRLAEFEAKISAGEKIEPKDWMPELYRKNLIRMISQHAHSEIVGMLPEGNWISRAPSLRRKIVLLAKVQDEAGHGLYLYNAAETLGVDRSELLDNLHTGKAKYSSIFNYPSLSWSDMGAIGWLVDGAAMVNQVSLIGTSYGPYSRALVRICKEEAFHNRQGYESIATLCNGTDEQKEMAQDSLNRWWWPSIMMFGPSDKDSPHSELSLKWGIKTESNDALRQKFINQTVSQAEARGLVIPDPNLKFNEVTKNYDFSEIIWDEFNDVVRGNGVMNKVRLKARNEANDDGKWVREAAMAYASKKNQTKVA